jgi:hypothetical protein
MLKRVFLFLLITLQSIWVHASDDLGEQLYWQPCRVINEDDYVQFKVQTDLKNNFSLTITAFENENCTVPYLVIERTFKIQSLENEKLNLITQKITYTSLSNEVSEALNMGAYCGFKNWKTKVEQNVTGRECDHYQQLKFGQAFYQILKSTSTQLWLGNDMTEKTGRSEALRPDTFDIEYQK